MLLLLAAMAQIEPGGPAHAEPAADSPPLPPPASDARQRLAALLGADVAPAFPVEPAQAPQPSPAERWGVMNLAVDLHPVGWHYGVRYQEILRDTMGGRRAPSTFGPTVAEADVYWRFEETSPGFARLPDDAAARWRDVAAAGSLLAVDRLVDETIRRAPQLQAFRASLDALVSPNLQVRGAPAGGVQVEHVTGGRRQRAVDRAESADTTHAPDPAPAGRQRAPEPRVGVGVDWKLRDEDAPPRAPLLGYGVWIDASQVGLTAMRADVSVVTGDWTLTARQRVYPRVFVYGRASGVGVTAPPERLAAGVLWVLPGSGAWTLRAERSVDTPHDGDGRGPGFSGGTRTTLTLRGEQHTAIPAREGDPRGDGGLCFPALPERAPNELAPLNPPTVDRWSPATCDRLR